MTLTHKIAGRGAGTRAAASEQSCTRNLVGGTVTAKTWRKCGKNRLFLTRLRIVLAAAPVGVHVCEPHHVCSKARPKPPPHAHRGDRKAERGEVVTSLAWPDSSSLQGSKLAGWRHRSPSPVCAQVCGRRQSDVSPLALGQSDSDRLWDFGIPSEMRFARPVNKQPWPRAPRSSCLADVHTGSDRLVCLKDWLIPRPAKKEAKASRTGGKKSCR